MKRYIKITTGILAIFAPGGGSLLFLDNNALSFSSTSPGGGALTKLVNYHYEWIKNNLKFNDLSAQSTNISLSENSDKGTKLDLSFDLSSKELLSQKDLDTKDSSKDIQTIFKEIDKEHKTIQLQKQIDSSTKKSQSKVKKSSSNFSKSHSIVKSSTNISPPPSRKKEILPDSFFLKLEHRKALQTYFKEYLQLVKEKRKFFNNLAEIKHEEKSSFPELASEEALIKSMLEGLTKVGWESEPYHILKHNSKAQAKPSRQKRSIQDPNLGWGDWETENPFKNFFSSRDEWNKFIKSIDEADKARTKYLYQPGRIIGGLFFTVVGKEAMNNIIFPELPYLEDSIKVSRNSLEVKMAEKMLKTMGISL